MNDLFSVLDPADQEKLEKKPLPEWMAPMLATLTRDRFSVPDWIYERKLDGERCLVFRNGDEVRLFSRNRKNINPQYPELVEAIAEFKIRRFVVDGEIVAFDGKGVSSFERLQPRINLSTEKQARRSDVKVYLYLFDLLYLDNVLTTKLPQLSRKRLLEQAFQYSDLVRYLPQLQEGEPFFEEACEQGWEGIIAKKADAAYAHRRSRNWLKFKCVNQQELVIGGYTEPHGERIAFGALLLGYYEGEKLRYAGKVGTGFDDETLRDLRQRLTSLERTTPPFDEPNLPQDEIHWVTPKLVAEIGFEEWTKHNKLRQSRYLGLRRDKPAKEVVKEA